MDDLSPMEPPGGWKVLEPTDRDPDSSIGWDIMLGADLVLLAIGIVATIAMFFMGALEADASNVDVQSARIMQWIAIAIGTLMFGIIPVVWAGQTRVGGWGAVPAYFGLTRPGINLALGGLAGIVMAFVIGGLLLGAEHLGWVEENPQVEQLLRVLTWPLIIGLSLQAGITEELLFRGVVQKYIGPYWQALVFGLAHFQQGWIGFVITGLIGLAFGILRHRKVSLYALIAAHTTYDLTLLIAAKLTA